MKQEQYYEIMQSYQPTFWKDFLEMREILRSGAGLLDSSQDLINIFVDDGFILTASEKKIYGIEQFFGFDGSNKTLDERKKYILFRFKGFKKFNATLIKQVCDFLINKDIEVSFTPSNILLNFNGLEILQYNCINEFYDFLYIRRPAHLGLLMTVKILNQSKTYYGIINNRIQKRSNRFTFDKDITSKMNIFYGTNLSSMQKRIIRTNLNKQEKIKHNNFYGILRSLGSLVQKRSIGIDANKEFKVSSNLYYTVSINSIDQKRVIHTKMDTKKQFKTGCFCEGFIKMTQCFVIIMQ